MTPHSPGGPDADPPDMPYRMSNLFAGVLRYLEARGILITLEAQEAFQLILGSVIWCAIAVVLAFTGWLLVVASVVDLIATLRGWPVMQTALAAGGIHVVLAVVAVMMTMRRLNAARWFAHTLGEFQKDRAWLAQQNEKH